MNQQLVANRDKIKDSFRPDPSHLKFPKLLVIIPAFNEELSIENVIEDVGKHCPQADILVINDGSTDETQQVAKRNGALVITLPTNLGIGGAMQTGYKFAYRNNYDFAVQVDGDGQHRAEELYKLLGPIISDEADFVIGSRFITPSGFISTMSRRIGIKILSVIVSFLVGKKVLDVTSGFRIASREAIQLFQSDYATDYPEVDSIVLLHQNKLRVKEVAVEMNPRTEGTSSINAIRSVYYMFKVILALLIRSIQKHKS